MVSPRVQVGIERPLEPDGERLVHLRRERLIHDVRDGNGKERPDDCLELGDGVEQSRKIDCAGSRTAENDSVGLFRRCAGRQ
jgi:hypothetical protein